MKHPHNETALNLKMTIVIARMVKAIDRFLIPEINARGLTPTQFSVMEALYHKGPLSVNEIIEKTLSSSGNMCLVIGNLLQSGFVSKAISEQDRRARKVELTEKGRRIIADVLPAHIQRVNTMLSGMTFPEKRRLVEQMQKLSRSISEQDKKS